MTTRITKQRLRITFGKHRTLRFIGHLDMAKMWERILRRAGLPVEYTQGFTRRPRTQFADALSLGLTSDGELLDVWLEEVVALDAALLEKLQAVSPADLKVNQIQEVEITLPSLPTLVRAAIYTIQPVTGFPLDFEERLTQLLAADSLLRQRGKKNYDLRPLIYALTLLDQNICQATLALGEGRTGRPHEVVDALGLNLLELRIHRSAILLQD